METDSIAALYAQVSTGRWASVVPYPWTRTVRPPTGTRILALHDPEIRSRIVLATVAAEPGSVLVRALLETARRLRLGELFAQDRASDPVRPA